MSETHGAVALSALTFFLVLPLAAAPTSDPSAEIELAKDLYRNGQYEDAIEAFEMLASLELRHEQKLVCLRYRAFALYLLARADEARAAWLQLLEVEPTYKLDPVRTSPEFMSFFGRLEPARKDAPIVAAPPPASVAPEPYVAANAPPPRGCGVVLCLVPFGVGQFSNDRPMKGTVFAAVEGLALGGNLYLYWSRVGRYGNEPIEQSKVKNALVAQQVLGGVLVTALLAGIVDAFVFP